MQFVSSAKNHYINISMTLERSVRAGRGEGKFEPPVERNVRQTVVVVIIIIIIIIIIINITIIINIIIIIIIIIINIFYFPLPPLLTFLHMVTDQTNTFPTVSRHNSTHHSDVRTFQS